MKSKSQKKRLDVLMLERGLTESRQKAQAMILAGEVSVDGAKQEKAGAQISEASRIEISSRLQKYASRGGLKLEGALADFSINPANLICLDLGSSTGGFTDCLLQHSAACVYAVDVSVDQLAWNLQQDARVIRIERNARELQPADIGPGGIVKDSALHEKAIVSVKQRAQENGLQILGVLPSRLTGAEGNQEFFLHARKIQ